MLEEVEAEEAIPLLMRTALEDSSVLVRHEAIETLGFMAPLPQTVELARKLTSDPQPEVAQTARIALEILQARRDREAAQSA